ncbi:MAG: hypothetical protein D6702_05875 [Planctomycetota bacterium]|nr:MAG: hypothetical protein D6702_05875 [Planctomycetota bacterium]
MLHPLRVLAAAALAAAFAAAPLAAQSVKVRVDVAPGSPQARRLELAGFVLEDLPPGADRIEIILPRTDLPRLAAYGWPLEAVAVSRPLREVIGSGPRALDGRFYDWGELNQRMLDLENQYPTVARRIDLTALTGSPATHQGRHIYALKISDAPAADEDEPNVLYVGNHHAREIGTPAHMVAWMEYLCSSYGVDPGLTALIDSYEIWVVPTMNPDGLEHVWNVDQWWRKNRRDNGGGVFGVDLNRNYPFKWAQCGSYSHSPSSETYVGPYAGSEPETQTMLALARSRRFVKVIDIHQSGREVLYSYPCGSLPAAAFDEVVRMRNVLMAAANYSTRLPSASGEHFEWEYAEIGALSYLLETDTTFFPTWNQSQAEYQRCQPAYRAMLEEPLPLTGHVLDAATGAPLAADISIAGVNWSEGELRRSGGAFGRYAVWLRDGSYDLTFTAAGYASVTHTIQLGPGTVEKDVLLSPLGAPRLELTGTPQVGQGVRFYLRDGAAYPGRQFHVVLSASGGGPGAPGIPVPGTALVLDLVNDWLSQWSLGNQGLLSGTVGSSGLGFTPLLTIPPAGAGLSVWAAAVLSQGSAHEAVTPAIQFDIR